MKIIGIRHIGIEVKNMSRMISYYKKLGYRKYWDAVESPNHTGFDKPVRTVKLRLNDSVIELTYKHPYKKHIAFDVRDTDEAIQWIRDPEGNMIKCINEELL